MRTRFISFLVVGALLTLSPPPLRAQSDTTFKLGTSNQQAVAHFRAGVNDYQNASFESANAHFKMALDADPNFGLARVMWAGTGQLSESQTAQELSRGVSDAAAHGSSNEVTLARAYRALALGQADSAKVLFTSAAQLMPNDALIAISTPGNPFGGDVAFYRALATRFPNYPLVYNGLAYSEWFAGNKDAAIAAAKRQTELNPSAPNPHDSYAEILQWNGDFAGATAHYKAAASLTPKFPEAYAGLAEVASLQGNYDQARSYLNQAIANAWYPAQKVGYLRQIAGTYAMEGTSSDALLKALDAAAAEAKAAGDLRQAAIIYSQLAATHAALGHSDVAHQFVQTATTTAPTAPWNVHYFAGVAHGLMKHWAPAQAELAKLKASTGAPPARVAALEGYLLTEQGKPADALTILMAADTTDPIVANRIAEAHAALGHPDEAAKWYNRINSNYAVSLIDFTNVNSRRRARLAVANKQ